MTPRNHRLSLDSAWLLFCIAASSIWIVTAGRQLGVTFDEPFYITQGLEFWRTGSHAALLKKGTMPLPVDVVTLPLSLWERWRGVPFDPALEMASLLPWARAGTLVFWWLLLIYGWLAGRSIGGPWGGRLAVAFLAAEPSLLGHASLATTDIAVTACLLALIYHFRTAREAGRIPRVAFPTFWYAAAILSKASGLVFGPICLLTVEIERLARSGAFRSPPLSSSSQAWLRHVLVQLGPFNKDLRRIIFFGLALVFLYCGSDWKAEPSFVAWAQSLPDGPAAQSVRWVAENLRIFPNAGQGLVKQIQHNIRGHGVFLLGDVQRRAIWYYFPVALSIKLSLGLLLLPVAVAVVQWRALRNWALTAAAVLLVFSLTSRVQIGIRLVLPLVVLASVGLAAAIAEACRESGSGWRRRLLASGALASVLWAATAATTVWPHGLAYANELWGGTEKGYLYLSDSNYDWGQGLKELAEWHRRHGLPPLGVWYFGTDPILQKLPIQDMPFQEPPVQTTAEVLERVRGRYLAVSTTLLYGAYVPQVRQVVYNALRTHRPVARTTTFLIYDFTRP